MLWIWPGIAAFLLFFLYDIASTTGRMRVFRAGFFVGGLLLLLSTAGLVRQGAALRRFGWTCLIVFGALALLFLALLLYTLFFALPFGSTYLSKETPVVCRRGLYALCRHPGVLWLAGLYFCLYLAMGTAALLTAAILFTLLDLAYVVLQDLWSFPRQFPDYGDYRKSTPFLLPNSRSIRQCIRTLRRTGDGSHEI